MRIIRVKKVTYKADSVETQKRKKEIEKSVTELWKNAIDRMKRSGNQQTSSVRTICNEIDNLWKEWDKLEKIEVEEFKKSVK